MTEEELYAGAGEVTRKCLDDILESEYGFVQDDEETYTSEYLLTYPCKTYAEGLTDTLLQHGFSGQADSGYQDEESMRRQAAANYIQSGHYREAMNVLQSLSQRNGQWYYLSSMANMGLGNNVNALNDIKQAIRLEPDNVQYQMVLQQMEGGGNWYQEMQNPFGGMPTGGDDYCMKLCLANMACSLCCPGSGVFCC